jgi:aspartate aminotransferase-like enzyme
MKDMGVDVVISAPQKGWTGPACAALLMLSDAAVERMAETQETSFSMSLKRWSAIMGKLCNCSDIIETSSSLI